MNLIEIFKFSINFKIYKRIRILNEKEDISSR